MCPAARVYLDHLRLDGLGFSSGGDGSDFLDKGELELFNGLRHTIGIDPSTMILGRACQGTSINLCLALATTLAET